MRGSGAAGWETTKKSRTRWARDNAPNAGGRRNALAAAEWLKGTAVILAETGPEETGR